jgi:phosphoribosyl 1,2-cyclic phosphodiesterase
MTDGDSADAPRGRTRLWILGSGSAGNAALVERDEHRVLVDAGFEPVELVARLREAGVAPATVDDVVLTHGHRDHVLGAAHGARVYGWRLWGTLGTVWRWRALREVDVRPFAPGDSFDIGAFRVQTAPTPHDVDDSAAVVVESVADGARAGYCTDLGHVTPRIEALLGGLDALVVESNHDPAMLRAGPYPPDVQARVAGNQGHLSNEQAARLVCAVAHRDLELVVLAHISRHNNTAVLAEATMRAALAGTDFHGRIVAARQDRVVGPFALRPSRALSPRR